MKDWQPLILTCFISLIVACEKKDNTGTGSDCNCDGSYLRIADSGLIVVYPSAFTPNNDGLNDIFRMVHIPGDTIDSVVSNFLLSVTRGHDAVVFQTEVPSTSWFGKDFADSALPGGLYNYKVHFTTPSGKTVDACGCVLLLPYNPRDTCLVKNTTYWFEDQFDFSGNPIYTSGEEFCP